MRPNLDEYFLAMLPLVASRGTCPRRQVACILVDDKGRLAAMAYNGNAAGLPHCDAFPCMGAPCRGGKREDCEAVHAEQNAILQAAASRRETKTAYCSLAPCKTCALALISIGVKRVVALERYKHDNDAGPILLAQAGVKFEVAQ